MRSRAAAVAIVTFVSLYADAAIAQLAIRPGRYGVTAEMDFGSGAAMKPQTEFDCVAPADVKEMSKLMLRDEAAKTCKLSDVKISPGTMTFNTCTEDGESYTGTTEMSFGNDWYSGVVRSEYKGHKMVIKMNGKWVGECVK